MSKKSFFIIFFLSVIGIYLTKTDKIIYDKITQYTNKTKQYFIDYILTTEEIIEKYFDQLITIDKLRLENQQLTKENILYQNSKDELDRIHSQISSMTNHHYNVKLVKVLSYVNFNDHSLVWLDIKKDTDSIDGLIINKYSVGIVRKQGDKTIALLNHNEKCNYAVYIGDNKATGITHGILGKEYISIKYIPKWMDIKYGDEVVTSGMSNIFPSGLKVGKVIQVIEHKSFQEAYVKPYINILNKRYFYLYYHN